MRASSWLFALLALAVADCRSPGDFAVEPTWATPKQGAVASEHPLATQAGLAVLDSGGNAADAAVAMALVLAVVHPQAGNLGGGGFALWVPHKGKPDALDFRECAPRAADTARYLVEGKPVAARSREGALSVAVPGTPAGLETLLAQHGSKRFTLAELARPALKLAREGFSVDPWLAGDLRRKGVAERMNPAARELFFPGGTPLATGALFVQKDLAETLRVFAERGASGFYRGRVAEALVGELARTPIPESELSGEGWITLEDLAHYQVKQREPLVGWFRGQEILTMPPPSSGGIVLLQSLGVLEGLPLESEMQDAHARAKLKYERTRVQPIDDPALSERMAHWWIESLRGAFADRAAFMGDPDFVDVPVKQLLAPEWIARRRIAIGELANPSIGPWESPSEGGQTTHLSVLDSSGNAVSLTTTLNLQFGSGILVRGGGFLLNDEMDDFSLAADSPNAFGLVGSAANAIRPGKRPLSSMTPTVVRDGGHTTSMVLGSPGGPRIISSVFEVFLRTQLFGQSLEEAVRAPRLHQQWKPVETEFEPGFDPEIVEGLRVRLKHPVRVSKQHFCSVQAIELDVPGGVPVAVSDPRRGGTAGLQGEQPSEPTPPGPDAFDGAPP
ncbi:MAG: gamma-glutamyltransferase [Planctomycetes bacterium]|nr:gamma-glutamyltransferase [Planctomycetota bacterium]